MQTQRLFDISDRQTAEFARQLNIVMGELEARVLAIVNGATVKGGAIDAATILNSGPQLLAALEQAGFNDLAASHAQGYLEIAEAAKEIVEKAGGDLTKFTTVSAQQLNTLAAADLQGALALGSRAVDELRLSLYRTALSGKPFSDIVAQVRAALPGQLQRYAYTYANTTNLQFAGETIRVLGEATGAEEWEVVGPDDEVTRDVCQAALADPVRTKEEWIAADYWGGAPGGYNCRHQLFPVLS